MLLLIAVFHIVMFASVKPVIDYVLSLFIGEIPEAETAGTKLDSYNSNSHCDRFDPSYMVEAKIDPVFIIHDFNRGYIWTRYEYWVYDKNANLLWGFANRFPTPPARWTIEKVNEEWVIVDVYEAP